MRVVFMGTGNIALPSFCRLLHKSRLGGLVTQPDRPVGRHQVLTPSAMKVMAEDAGVPVLQPESMRAPEAIQELAALEPDLIVVMSYGQILTEEALSLPSMGCINVHASLLPRHRGASCIAAAIREGDKSTGITIMHMVKKLDAGDIIRSVSLPLMGKETAGMMTDVLAHLAPDVLMDAIHSLESGTATRTRQNEYMATYAPKLTRANGLVDWSLPAIEIERMTRAYDPWPGTYTFIKDRRGRDKKMKIFPCAKVKKSKHGVPGEVLGIGEHGLLVACGEGALLVPSIQLEGGRKMPASQLLTGRLLDTGALLTSPKGLAAC